MVQSQDPAQRPDATLDGDSKATAPAAPPADKKRGAPARVVLPVFAIMLLAAAVFAYRYYLDQQTYVSTENALVAGALLQVGSLNSGQVAAVAVDVGDAVKKDQSLAVVTLPSAISSANGATKLGFRGTDDLQVQVKSPADGVVVSRSTNPGDTVAVGQPMLTVVDPAKLWVQAQIEETKVGRVKVGQPVEVYVDALGITLPGRVQAIGRASSATFSLMPAGNSSGNFTKVTQLVPVKISLDYDAEREPLTLGTSVVVKIRVAE